MLHKRAYTALPAAGGAATAPLPVRTDPAAGPATAAAQATAEGAPRSGLVLIVEDNPITRKLLRVALELGGFAVVDAGDGRSALEILTRQRPDLLVLDFVLPDMDGLELLGVLRKTLGAETPAVIVTGMVSQLEALRDHGTPFTHFLPKPVEPSNLLNIVRSEMARPRAPAGGRRVLVVDDDVLNRKLTSVRLEMAGYDVETVASGLEALVVARRNPPDAILSDVMMPVMDGFSFCREARRDPALRAVPIILISAAYVDEEDRELARQMGANALVVRTPDLREASACLADVLATAPAAPVVATSEVVDGLHRERLQVQLERQNAHSEMLLRQAAIQATALSLMRGLSDVLAEPRTVPQILGNVLAHCLDAAGLSTGLLYNAEPGGEHRLQAQFGLPAHRKQDADASFGHPDLIRGIGRAGVPVAFSDATRGLDAETRDFLGRVGQSSVLILPFVVLGETYGALVLASDDHDLSDPAWIGFARSLGLQFGQTVALGQSLKRLAESEKRYRTLVEQATDAIFVLDAEGSILEANHESETMLGVPRDRIIGRNIASFSPLSSADALTYAAEFAASVSAGGGRQDNVVVRRGDGTLVEVDFALSVNEIDGKASVLSIGRDVTQRNRDAATLRQAQVRLADSAEEYRLLFDRNPHSMWVHDWETFEFLAVNDAALRHYGYSREEFLARAVLDILPPEDIAVFLKEYETAKDDEGTYFSDRPFRHVKKDGTFIETDIAASQMVFGGRRAWLLLATDVTEKQALQGRLVEAQKMEAVGRLAGGIAHDFNNLLGVITGYSELLARELPPDSRASKRAEEIASASDRAAALTRQLLAFSRRQVLQPRVLDLNDVVGEVEKMLRRLISADIQMVTVLATDLGHVRADAGQVEQVLMNLALNARDAMDGGGRLVIETANVDLDDAYVRANPGSRAGGSVVLAVSDSGHGMTADTMSRIFEPFFTTKETGKGTGLGLATVYGIVRQSGGTVRVSSELGHGTTFTVYLPRVEEAVEVKPPAGFESAPGGTETILLVEDAEALRMVVREILEDVGYTVRDADSPDAALAFAHSTSDPIHLVLTDIVMPQMSGPELARRIAGIKPRTRVVFMSGYADQGGAGAGTLSPETPFLQKPFTTDALLTVLRRALDGPPMPPEGAVETTPDAKPRRKR